MKTVVPAFLEIPHRQPKARHHLRCLALSSFFLSAFAASAVQVTFLVNMSVQISNIYFIPANGDLVEARGDFNGWSGGFTLTNSSGNTNVYTGTWNDTNSPGSPQQYKFDILSGGSYVVWENDLTPTTDNNRMFSLSSSPQILPVVYFDDLAPGSGVPMYSVTFQVDMTGQITNGYFSPTNGDYVEARGTFETPNQWTSGFQLTNNPNAANTNLYTGTYPDANYLGTQEGFKFVIANSNASDKWESVANHPFTLVSNNQVLPALFFNDQPGTLLPVTFQVDMSVQVTNGTFNPGNGDFVEAWGTFQAPNGWSGGFQLTNNPHGPNTNLYSGTYADANAPGTSEQFKFVVDGGGGLGWEKPASTGGDNRTFVLSSTNQTLPAVFFDDLDFSSVLASNTLVTFNVSMSNAVGTEGYVFNPEVDYVFINGDFLNWWPWGEGFFYPYDEYALENNPEGSLIYTISLMVPAGSPVKLNYKYGIDGIDDESGFKANHVRYIRGLGTFAMPLDTFGTQTAEPSFGNLAVHPPSGGHVLVTWLGRPGVHLQTATNLASTIWQDQLTTDGLSATNWPIGPKSIFFRLIQP